MKSILDGIKSRSGIVEEYSDSTKHDNVDIASSSSDPTVKTEIVNKEKMAKDHFVAWMSKPSNVQKGYDYLKKNEEKLTSRSIVDSAMNLYLVKKIGGENAEVINGMPKDNIKAIKLLAERPAMEIVKKYKERLEKWKSGDRKTPRPTILGNKRAPKETESIPQTVLIKKNV